MRVGLLLPIQSRSRSDRWWQMKPAKFSGRRIKTHRKTQPQRLPANIAAADAVFGGIFGLKRVGAKQ